MKIEDSACVCLCFMCDNQQHGAIDYNANGGQASHKIFNVLKNVATDGNKLLNKCLTQKLDTVCFESW